MSMAAAVRSSAARSSTEGRVESWGLRVESTSRSTGGTGSATPNTLHGGESLRLGHGVRLSLSEDLRGEEFRGRVGGEGGERDGSEGRRVRAGVHGGNSLRNLWVEKGGSAGEASEG